MDVLMQYSVFLIPLVLLHITLAVTAVVHALRHPHYKFGNKLTWVLVAAFVQIIGPILYFAFGKGEE